MYRAEEAPAHIDYSQDALEPGCLSLTNREKDGNDWNWKRLDGILVATKDLSPRVDEKAYSSMWWKKLQMWGCDELFRTRESRS